MMVNILLQIEQLAHLLLYARSRYVDCTCALCASIPCATFISGKITSYNAVVVVKITLEKTQPRAFTKICKCVQM